MRAITEMRTPLVFALAATLLAGASGAARASGAGEEQRGAEVLSAVERGERKCADLGQTDFEAVGEFAMGRMLGSRGAHERMDRMMASMMGEGGLDRMHQVMGARFSGCASPRLPGGFAGMMGAMGMMGGFGGAGMMGGGDGLGGGSFPGQGLGPAAMMGPDREDDDDAAVWMAAAMVVLVAVAVLAVILVARPGRRHRGSSPLDLLTERFARGEIGAEEYAERRRLLEEGAG